MKQTFRSIRRSRGRAVGGFLVLAVAAALLLGVAFLLMPGKRGHSAAGRDEKAPVADAAPPTPGVPTEPLPSSCAAGPSPISAAAAEPAVNGVHVVVDASLSMCGYLRADESQRFRQLVNQLMQWSDKQRDHRVMLLHQSSADERLKRVEDIREAPSDFDAILGNAFARHTGCSLFDGARSDIELAFAAAAAKDAPHSFVLISDLLLKDAAQRSFANAFRDWFGAQPPGSAVSAGIVTIALPFAGNYYSANVKGERPSQSLRVNLPLHERPLNLIWFAATDEDARAIRLLLSRLQLLDTPRPEWLLYGVQVAPLPSENPADWLQPQRPAAPTALFTAFSRQIVAPRSRRDGDSLLSCVNAPVCSAADELTVRIDPRCRDNRQLFDATVDAVQLTLHTDTRSGFVVAPAPGSADSPARAHEKGLLLELRRATPVQVAVPLRLSAVRGGLDRERLDALTLRDEDCLAQAKTEAQIAACTRQMQRRTYGYRSFVELFAERAADARDERAATQGEPPVLHLVFDPERVR